jgi:prepilin-type N-terminal cleavage/methylation domain-containing protein
MQRDKNKFMKKNITSNSSGFTLIEMIVSLSIFTIAMLILVSALISLSEESRKARSIRVVTDNLGAATESMARSIRMGRSYNCGCVAPLLDQHACPMTDAVGSGGAECIAFLPQTAPQPALESDLTIFRFDEANNRITRSLDGETTVAQQFTAPEMRIHRLKFYVNGVTQGIDQPAVTIVVGGVSGDKAKTSTEYNLQTTISSRTPNFIP